VVLRSLDGLPDAEVVPGKEIIVRRGTAVESVPVQ